MARKQVKEKKVAKHKLKEAEQPTKGKARTRNSKKEDANQNVIVNDEERINCEKPKNTKECETNPGRKRETRKRKSEEIKNKVEDTSSQPVKKIKTDKKDKDKTSEISDGNSSKGKTQAKTNLKAKSSKAKKENGKNKSTEHQSTDKSNIDVLDINFVIEKNGGVNGIPEQEDIPSSSNIQSKTIRENNGDLGTAVEQDKTVLQKDVGGKFENTGCDSSDIMSVLMQMEGPSAAPKQAAGLSGTLTCDDTVMSDSDKDGSEDEQRGESGKKVGLAGKKKFTKKSQKPKTKEETVSKHFKTPKDTNNEKNDTESEDDEDFVSVNDKIVKSCESSAVAKLVAAKKRQTKKRKSQDSVDDLDSDFQGGNSRPKKSKAVRNRKKKKDDNEVINSSESVKNKTDSRSSSLDKPVPNAKDNRQKSKTTKTASKQAKERKDVRNEEIRIETSKSLNKKNDKKINKIKSDVSENKSAKSKKPKTSDKVKEEKEIKTEKKEVLNNVGEHIPTHIKESSDVMSILMHMEGPSTSQGQGKVTESVDEEMMSDSDSEEKMNTEDDSDESEGEWEDVEDHHVNSPKKSQTPSKSVEITLDAPVIYKKRKKKEFNLHDYLKKQVNKYKRELALDMHKVHLLCLVSRGFYLNSVCEKDILRAQVMSVVMTTRELTNPVMKRHSQGHLTSVLKWMNQEFQLSDTKCQNEKTMEDRLVDCLQSRSYTDNTQYTLLCILVLRYLGFMTRSVMSLQPVPYKQAQKSSSPKTNKKSSKTKSSKVRPRENKTTKQDTKESVSKNKATKQKSTKKQKSKQIKKENTDSDITEKETDSHSSKRNKRRCSKNLSKGAYKDQDEADVDDVDGDIEDDLDADFKAGDESDSDDSECESSVKDSNETRKKKGKGKKPVKKILKQEDSTTLSSDSDFDEDSILIRTKPLKKEPSSYRNKKVLSSDSESSPKVDSKHWGKGNDTWLEVYIEAENKWLSVCSQTKEVTKPAVIRSYATSPLYYVIAIDNNHAIKDVTIRYASEWLTKTRKLRVEDDWWTETLEPFMSKDKEQDVMEDKDMQAYLLQGPLPTSISQFKGHPLYILKRHLLKYEALYPNTIVPVGYIRGEPVYSRDCCHTLHSRENWLKEGRCVRLKEEPYKYVKSRKRWNDKDTEPKECELFGKWQTEIYMPPPAVDGVIPRNAHGNVEMFQPWMLPGGTVHLKGLPALNRIARKLNLDCAPAMVGWDHHCGYAHPVMDGWIVCEEHKDILLAAWDEEQEIIQEREKEKREKRVYGNWKKLIRGLIIKERLKQRYDQEDMPITAPSQPTEEPSTNEGEKATDVEQSWPQNRLTKSKSKVGIVEKL